MRAAPIAVFTPDTDDVLEALRSSRKRLPSRLLYDARGTELFEQLSHAEDFYPTRTEHDLLVEHGKQIAHQVGPEARIVEVASGESTTSHQLLGALERPASYTLIATSREQLDVRAGAIHARYPALDVLPVLADMASVAELPVPQHEWRRTLVYFPGGAIGTLEPSEARTFLGRIARLAGEDRLLLIGADSTRDPSALLRAYDDDSGIAESFGKNALANLNRTRGATFDLDAFEHRAVWSAEASRVELQLVSRTRQIVRVGDQVVTFAPGEPLVVEHCYKHTPEAMRAILASAGWRPRQVFTSTHEPYRLWLCEPLIWSQVR